MFNAPRRGAAARHRPLRRRAAAPAESADWFELLPRTAVQPDTPHRFRVAAEAKRPATHARLDIYPDGGIARLRILGSLTQSGTDALTARWSGTPA